MSDTGQLASDPQAVGQRAADALWFGPKRLGAVIVFDLDTDAMIASAATDLARQLQPWARDIDLYALAIHLGDMSASGATPTTTRVDPVPAGVSALLWRLECFAKPCVSLLSGTVSPTLFACALAGTHRASSHRCTLHVGDLRHGKLPAGVTVHKLARLPDGIGAYLLLTGQPLPVADALALGLLTHTLDESAFQSVVSGLQDAEPIDPLLDQAHLAPPTGDVLQRQELIARHFSATNLDAIQASLQRETGAERIWAEVTCEALSHVQPPIAHVALEVLRRSRALDIRETFILVHRVNGALQLRPLPQTVDQLFDHRVGTELMLPTRAELQSLRRM